MSLFLQFKSFWTNSILKYFTVSFGIEEEDELVGDAPSVGNSALDAGANGNNNNFGNGKQLGAASNAKGLLMLDHGLVGDDSSKEDGDDDQLPVAN